MIVNAALQETRIAVTEDDRLTEIFIERAGNRGIVGNIYKGRVDKVLPGMQSAFVDIGLEKDAFLYVTDVQEHFEEYDRIFGYEELNREENGSKDTSNARGNDRPEPSIDDLLREGQEIPVQVLKEPIAGKGARITTNITLPGRFLVYMPTVNHIGISRKIENEEERERLRTIITDFKKDRAGLIVRTAGEGKTEKEFSGDFQYLKKLWGDIKQKAEVSSAPTMLRSELGLVNKVIRDVLSDDFTSIIIDTDTIYWECLEFLNTIQPEMAGKVQLYSKDYPIFEEFGIEVDIENCLKSRIWLKSGGYIVINQTEALVAIDVNTGKYVGKRSLEDTVVKTNIEAVKEIVRQIRLRDLGGIIVVDFIDMEEKTNRDDVMAELEKELRNDRSKTKILQISDFGLVEITRKRVKQSLEKILCQPCHYCEGTGRIRSIKTICFHIYREIMKMERNLQGSGVLLRVNSEVAKVLNQEERAIIEDLEQQLNIKIDIKSDSNLHHENFDLMVY